MRATNAYKVAKTITHVQQYVPFIDNNLEE